MIIYELTNSESNPVYQNLEISNGNRQYDFLRSMVLAALAMGRPFLSQTLIKALNFHSIACLHTNAVEFRPCEVKVGDYTPPAHFRVQAQMDDFVNQVNWLWTGADAVALATFVLWRLNNIHPFINGNGRTARASSYFILCVKAGGWLPGSTILPELLRQNRDEYVAALKIGDTSEAAGQLDLSGLHALISRLLNDQLQSVSPDPPASN
jgi:hypothetical protein